MRPIAIACIAALLLIPLAPTAVADTRVVVYCDIGSCPGVAAGKRYDGCNGGIVGTCSYMTREGTGGGVFVGGPDVCTDPYCIDVRVNGRCPRVATNAFTIACAFALPFSVADLVCATYPGELLYDCTGYWPDVTP